MKEKEKGNEERIMKKKKCTFLAGIDLRKLCQREICKKEKLEEKMGFAKDKERYSYSYIYRDMHNIMSIYSRNGNDFWRNTNGNNC